MLLLNKFLYLVNNNWLNALQRILAVVVAGHQQHFNILRIKGELIHEALILTLVVLIHR